MRRRSSHTQHITALVLSLSAGFALGRGALAQLADEQPASQPAQPPKHRDATQDRARPAAEARSLVFVSGNKVHGMTVKNAVGKSLGTIDDLIIDRGSGRVRYLSLKSGATLGLGGKLVTVPYASFGWDQADKNVTLSATPEEIKGWPEFDKDRWMQGRGTEDSFIRTLGKDYYDPGNAPWPLQANADSDGASTVRGSVKNIVRRNTGGTEELVVVVSSSNQPDREIYLGPSWYLSGNNSISFYRDAPIEIQVFRTTRDGRPVEVARAATINGHELGFYDKQGEPSWAPSSAAGATDPFAAVPFVLASEIKGKPVDCRGEKCGKIKDLVMECTTGRIGFVSIDPDKNFLGIGDEDRLVPWTLVTRSADGAVHVDATTAMLKRAAATPKDLKALGESNVYKTIYGAYDTQPERFMHAK